MLGAQTARGRSRVADGGLDIAPEQVLKLAELLGKKHFTKEFRAFLEVDRTNLLFGPSLEKLPAL